MNFQKISQDVSQNYIQCVVEMTRKTSLFSRRLERHYDELKWLYQEIYCDEQAFSYFLSMLERSWGERKRSLRDQDARREADPHWYRRRDLLGLGKAAGGGSGKHLGDSLLKLAGDIPVVIEKIPLPVARLPRPCFSGPLVGASTSSAWTRSPTSGRNWAPTAAICPRSIHWPGCCAFKNTEPLLEPGVVQPPADVVMTAKIV